MKNFLKTMVVSSVTLDCKYCELEVYQCDGCGRYFESGQDVYCDNEGCKHYCCDCGESIDEEAERQGEE